MFTKFMQVLIIIAFIVLITFSPSIHFISYIEFHDYQRIIQLFLLGFVLVDAIFIQFNSAHIVHVSKKIKLGFLVILACAIISAFLCKVPRYAVIEATVFVALCYLALFVTRQFQDNKEALIKQLTYALWVGILLYMLSFYVGFITATIFKTPLVWPAPFFGFSSIREFNQVQLWSIGLVCLPLFSFSLKKNIRLYLYIALSCWWVLLFYTASRGAVLGWMLGMLATAFLYKKLAWSFLRIQLINAGSGLGGYLFLFKFIPYCLESSANVTSTVFRDTVSDRTDLWNAAFMMMKTNPIFGVGPMHFYFYNPFGTHPHNSVLQIAAEWGLPATLIIMAILSYMAKCWFKQFEPAGLINKNEADKQLAIILFFTIIANGAYSLVDGVIVMPISQALMFTVIGLMIGQYTSGSWYTTTPTLPRKFGFRPILAALTLGFMVWSVMPELVMGLTSYQRYYQPGDRAFALAPKTINPRIWMQQRRVEPSATTTEAN